MRLENISDAEIVAAVRGAKDALDEPARPLASVLAMSLVGETILLGATSGSVSFDEFTVGGELQGDWEVIIHKKGSVP